MISCTWAERATGLYTGQLKAELLSIAVKLDLPNALAVRAQPTSLASLHRMTRYDLQCSCWQRCCAL